MTAPRYQDVPATDIPEVIDDDGTRVRVICGEFWGKRGPVDGVAADPRYLDISVPPGRRKTLAVETAGTRSLTCSRAPERFTTRPQPFGVLTEKDDWRWRHPACAKKLEIVRWSLFGSGDEVTVQAGEEGIRFLLVSGKPIEEPVAWYGPIVMNTKAELQQAVTELRNGTFIKHS